MKLPNEFQMHLPYYVRILEELKARGKTAVGEGYVSDHGIGDRNSRSDLVSK